MLPSTTGTDLGSGAWAQAESASAAIESERKMGSRIEEKTREVRLLLFIVP